MRSQVTCPYWQVERYCSQDILCVERQIACGGVSEEDSKTIVLQCLESDIVIPYKQLRANYRCLSSLQPAPVSPGLSIPNSAPNFEGRTAQRARWKSLPQSSIGPFPMSLALQTNVCSKTSGGKPHSLYSAMFTL